MLYAYTISFGGSLRINKIWTLSKIELENTVKNSVTLSEILRSFNITTSSANYTALKQKMKKDNINYNHIKLGLNSNAGKKLACHKDPIPLELIMVQNSTYSRIHLKARLLKMGILKNQCYNCEMFPIWQNKPLSLQIDHINGISDDNRLENLRILCPNCHAQTDTFSGKKRNISLKITSPS